MSPAREVRSDSPAVLNNIATTTVSSIEQEEVTNGGQHVRSPSHNGGQPDRSPSPDGGQEAKSPSQEARSPSPPPINGDVEERPTSHSPSDRSRSSSPVGDNGSEADT